MDSLTTPIGLLLLSGVACTVVTSVTLSRSNAYSRGILYPFAALSASGAVWALAYAMLLLTPSPSGMLPWFRLVIVSAAVVPALWMAFVLAYVGHRRTLSRRVFAALSLEPLVFAGSVVTGSGLFIDGTVATTAAGYSTLVPVPGPLLFAHFLYSFALNAAALVLLARLLSGAERLYRRQTLVLIIAAFVPMASALPIALGLSGTLDITPMTFWVNNGLVLFALLRYRLLDVVPGARAHLFERLDDGIVILDAGRRVIEMNAAACDAFGFEDAPVGSAATDALPRAATVLSLLDGDESHVELVVDDERGRRVLDVTATTDSPRGSAILVVRDVTERRHVERQFRALIENSHDIIVVLDAGANFEYVSPSMESVMGHDPDEHVHEHPFDYIHPDDREQAIAVLHDAIESGAPERAEYRYRHADGSWRTFEAVGISLLDDPAVEGVIISARDVTDRHQYEQRLRVLNRVLRHDLRNDMNVVLGYADLLHEGPNAPEVREYAQKIHDRAASLADLADRTRFVDRTLNRTPEEYGAVDVARLVDEELVTARRTYPEATFTATVSGEHWVRGDDRIRVAIRNVVENAVEHNDRDSPSVVVAVDTAVDDGGTFVEVSVADDGPGIPQEERSVLESGVETPLEHGSGVGLWLVNWTLAEVDGELSFADNDPRGSVVMLRLHGTTPEPDGSDVRDMSSDNDENDERDESDENVDTSSKSET